MPQQPVQRKIVVAHLDVRLADAPVRRQRQRHGVFRHRLGAVARHAQHRYAKMLGGGQVHMVVPRAAQKQQPDPRPRQDFQHRGAAVGIDKHARRIPALRQRRGVGIQIRRQIPDAAAIRRVFCQHVKIIVVVLVRAEKHNGKHRAASLWASVPAAAKIMHRVYLYRANPGRAANLCKFNKKIPKNFHPLWALPLDNYAGCCIIYNINRINIQALAAAR